MPGFGPGYWKGCAHTGLQEFLGGTAQYRRWLRCKRTDDAWRAKYRQKSEIIKRGWAHTQIVMKKRGFFSLVFQRLWPGRAFTEHETGWQNSNTAILNRKLIRKITKYSYLYLFWSSFKNILLLCIAFGRLWIKIMWRSLRPDSFLFVLNIGREGEKTVHRKSVV